MARRAPAAYDAAPAPQESPTVSEQQLAAESDAVNASGTPAQREAAAKRRSAAHSDVMGRDQAVVDALLIERRGYVQRGRADRVAQVDEQLARHGHVVEG